MCVLWARILDWSPALAGILGTRSVHVRSKNGLGHQSCAERRPRDNREKYDHPSKTFRGSLFVNFVSSKVPGIVLCVPQQLLTTLILGSILGIVAIGN